MKSGLTVEGTVSANRAGYGFLRVAGLKDSVFLLLPQMRGVMHGDRLRVKVSRDATDRWSGSVEQVLERGVTAFLGTLQLEGRSAWVSAADRRLQLGAARLHLRTCTAPRTGEWVIARITRHAGSASHAQAVIEKCLDPDRPVELATESAIARFDLPQEFPGAALREARAFGEQVDGHEAGARLDLREVPLVTIDGEDARDFDDAVYAEAHPQGFRLLVAIADVSHYMNPGTALDAEAQRRGTSVYFPTRVLPMLPTALSDHLCSLAAAVDRLCFAADMVVSRSGALKSARFYPAVMRSAARLTYSSPTTRCSRAAPPRVRSSGRCSRNYSRWWMCIASCTRRAATAAHSISTPPRPFSSSMRPSGCAPSRCAPATRHTVWSRSA